MESKKKLCFIASSGGHYEQLLMLRPLMQDYDSFIVTEKCEYSARVENCRTYYLQQVNRKELFCVIKLLGNLFRAVRIFCREKPDCVITTGVLAVIPFCLLAKLLGKKLIYIESFAKTSSATRTGRLMYHFADRFYVQWESMLQVYPKAVYAGGIY